MIWDQIYKDFDADNLFAAMRQIRREDEYRVLELTSYIETFTLYTAEAFEGYALYGKDRRLIYNGNNWDELVIVLHDNFQDNWI
jgi:hypothetical protein